MTLKLLQCVTERCSIRASDGSELYRPLNRSLSEVQRHLNNSTSPSSYQTLAYALFSIVNRRLKFLNQYMYWSPFGAWMISCKACAYSVPACNFFFLRERHDDRGCCADASATGTGWHLFFVVVTPDLAWLSRTFHRISWFRICRSECLHVKSKDLKSAWSDYVT